MLESAGTLETIRLIYIFGICVMFVIIYDIVYFYSWFLNYFVTVIKLLDTLSIILKAIEDAEGS